MRTKVTLPKLLKPCHPGDISNHKLFGGKYQRVHQFNDIKWQLASLKTQFESMRNVLVKNREYKKIKYEAEHVKKRHQLQRLRTECSDGLTRLKRSKQGDLQRIKRILVNHPDLFKLYSTLPSHLIIENIAQITCNKKKKFNILLYHSKLYQDRLIKLLIEQSKIEDRIQYEKEFELPTEIKAKMCHKTLQTNETRLKNAIIIQRGYKKILSVLKGDQLFFERVLKSLENDIMEQKNLSDQVVLMGVPAMEDNKKVHQRLMEMFQEIKSLQDHRNKYYLETSKNQKANVKNTTIIAREFSLKTEVVIQKFPRYTESMENLKKHEDDLEQKLRGLKTAINCNHTRKMLPLVSQEKKSIQALNKQIRNDKLIMKLMNLMNQLGNANVGKVECGSQEFDPNYQTITELKFNVEKEKLIQKECNEMIVHYGNVMDEMKINLMNLNDILRHVLPKPDHAKREYPNPELDLPLLFFKLEDRVRPQRPLMVTLEINLLFDSLTKKIMKLTRYFEKKEGFMEKGDGLDEYKEIYHLLNPYEPDDMENGSDGPKFEEKIDPNILTNEKIKQDGNKIIEAHLLAKFFAE